MNKNVTVYRNNKKKDEIKKQQQETKMQYQHLNLCSKPERENR